MKLTHGMSILTTLASSGTTVAIAQPIEQIEYSIAWDKPVLMPGEVQTGHVWLKVTPDIGSAVQWNTMPGTGQAATLKAIASSIMNVTNVANGLTGSMTYWKQESGWNASQFGGKGDGNGGIKQINVGQFADPWANTNPSVNVFLFVWDPLGDYAPRTVTYEVSATTGKVWLEVPGLSMWVGENAVKIASQSSFQIVPGPGAVVLFAGLVPLLARRARRAR